MAMPAGRRDRKATFRRRVAAPTTPGTLRGGFEDIGQAWANFRDTKSREIRVGGFPLQAKTGLVTVVDTAFTRGITASDRVVVGGLEFEIAGVGIMGTSEGDIRLEVVEAPTGAMYARQMDQDGESVTLRRPGTPNIDRVVRGKVTGFDPEELLAGIDQGDRKVVISASDVAASGFPLPFKTGSDRIIVRGRTLMIEDVDDSTHRSGDGLHAYEIRARG